MMDRIYLKRVTASEKYARWDKFFYAQSAPKAVRNRKVFFQSILGYFCTSPKKVKSSVYY